MASTRTVKVHPDVSGKTREITMALISLKNLGVTMSAPLFAKLDLTIGSGDRLGIVAANGCGKSTLLKCLTGEMEPSSGDITRTRGLRVGHVEQSVAPALLGRSFYQVVADALPAEQADSETLAGRCHAGGAGGARDAARASRCRQLSGGWQRIALIARVRVGEPDVLLLDEPTNHLDLSDDRPAGRRGSPACRATCRSSSPATTAPSSTP